MRILKGFAFAGLIATSALTAASAPHVASAQPAPADQPPASIFDAAAKRRAIETAAKLLTDDYVFPDMGAKAAALLTQNLAAGAYNADATPGAFATHLTKDLQALTHDAHLRVFADGVVPDDLPPKPLPSGWYEFAQADRLKGNIGYIVLNGFVMKAISRQGADEAMGLLASTDALIIDLRHNGGGDPQAVAYLVSFFFDAKTPVHVIDVVRRKPGTADFDRQVDSTEPTPVSYLGKPVYLITSSHTFSGGEEFAYDMQTLKRAIVVGEATGGGAHPGGRQPIGPELSLFVPVGRSESPITHTDWEGKGVQPDIAVPADQGFDTSYTTALHALGRQGPAHVENAEAVTEAHLLPPTRTTAMPGSETALRRLLIGFADGHPPYDLLEDNLADLARTQEAEVQADLSPLGALQTLTFVKVVFGQDIYDAKFEKGTRRFMLILNPNGKIAIFTKVGTDD